MQNDAASDDPRTYQKNPDYKVIKDIEEIYKRFDNIVEDADIEMYTTFLKDLIAIDPQTPKAYTKAMASLRRKHKPFNPRKSSLLYMYNSLVNKGILEENLSIKSCLVKKSSKSESGVLVITVLTSPYPEYTNEEGKRVKQSFSCEFDCYYCPNEPGQPRSYLHDEPSVLRANHHGFDPVLQFTTRAATLAINGHPVDKIELLVLGGTWSSYPEKYQEEFIRDLFFAANTFNDRNPRGRLSLEEEQRLNESAPAKIIGITLETRPDVITPDEVKRFRRYGCTRVQIGVQHTDDKILKKINRGCYNADTKRAIRLLKDACYKIDIHLMPNLPNSTPEIDRKMFNEVLFDPDLQVDQWKIYPCETVPWTVIKQWFDKGQYVPYPDEDLIDVLLDAKSKVHPWIRLNRVIRDIPSQYILGGVDAPNLRQDLVGLLKQRGERCDCIRCREVGDRSDLIPTAKLFVRSYEASEGVEHFISFETPDELIIFGFLRLRLPKLRPKSEMIFEELHQTALIRELHVYGQLIATTNKKDSQSQHTGFGKQMMSKAESIARKAGYTKLAVISGEGTRNYYRKIGYELEPGEGRFMTKELEPTLWESVPWGVLFALLALVFSVVYMALKATSQ